MIKNILGAKLPVLLNEIKVSGADTYIEIGCFQCGTMRFVRKAFPNIHIIGFDLFEPHEGETEQGKGKEFAPLDGDPLTFDQARELGFEVYQGDTNESLPRIFPILRRTMKYSSPVLVFLDGGHSYETVRSDYMNVSKFFPGATVVFDDISYPGVAQLIRELPSHAKKYIGIGLIAVYPFPMLPKIL
jgi:hypothetical protein